MELTVFNYTGQPLMLFTSKNYYNRQYVKHNMPGVDKLLSSIRDQSWLSSLEGSIYADKVDQLVSSIKGLLSPQLEYQDFILAGDVSFLNNLFDIPNFVYCVGITSTSGSGRFGDSKLALSFNTFDTKNILGKYNVAQDLISSIKLYLGYQSQFYCDSVTPDGSAVCDSTLPKSATFINDMYALRHNPRIMQVDSPTPVGTNFDKSMIENINITDHMIIKQPDIANPIPQPGLVEGQTVVAYLFFDSNEKSIIANSDVKQSFTLEQETSPWASIAILLIILLVVAIVIGVIMYVSKNGGSINVFTGKGEKQPAPIMI